MSSVPDLDRISRFAKEVIGHTEFRFSSRTRACLGPCGRIGYWFIDGRAWEDGHEDWFCIWDGPSLTKHPFRVDRQYDADISCTRHDSLDGNFGCGWCWDGTASAAPKAKERASPRPDLARVYACEKCGNNFPLGEGSLISSGRGRDRSDPWMIACTDCSTEFVYWVAIDDGSRGFTRSQFDAEQWTNHLCEKVWFGRTEFVRCVERLNSRLDERFRLDVNGIIESSIRHDVKYHSRKPPISQPIRHPPNRQQSTVAEARRQGMSLRLRFTVMERDGFTCRYCGANGHGVKLHVDHVVAVANGGTNDPSNLVTACKECNLGKGARHLSPTQPEAKA